MPFGPKITAFLAAIRVMPNVTRAARAAKINRSLHYAKLKSSAEYAAEFQLAEQMGYDAVSDVAVTRATEGWQEPVVYQGRIALQEDPVTGKSVPVTVPRIDNQLLRFILESRHPKYRERVEGGSIHFYAKRTETRNQQASYHRERFDCSSPGRIIRIASFFIGATSGGYLLKCYRFVESRRYR